jgi:hypothetical protein
MGTVVFVHGTGVRRARFDTLFARVSAGFAEAAPEFRMAPCCWGDRHGSRLAADGATIPAPDTYRAAAGESDVDDDVLSWALLDLDPLFELRLATLRLETVEDIGPPDAVPPGEALGAALREASRDDRFAALLAEAQIATADFDDAVTWVVQSEPFAQAVARPAAADVLAALVRAVVAATLHIVDARIDGSLPVTGDLRDELVVRLAVLVGSERGIGTNLARVGVRLAMKLGATRPIERRRLALTEAASPASGDVLKYLARGSCIRAAIGTAITAATPPVVIVAHSLGGIACVDLLTTVPTHGVDLLVTVGSQAPLLYELDALPSLSYGEPLPHHFPAWLNVYDPRDLLAFLASPVFPEAVDHRLDNRAPFPRSHSAYFGNPEFYRRVAEALP